MLPCSRRARRWSIVVALILPAGAVAACSSSSSPSGYTGPRTTECSNGPPRTEGPPYATSTATTRSECVPRCGEVEFAYESPTGTRYSLAALPSGACAYEGETCQMSAGHLTICPNRAARICDRSAYECRCAAGQWECITVSQGAGTCGGCEIDAGTHGDAAPSDASTDG